MEREKPALGYSDGSWRELSGLGFDSLLHGPNASLRGRASPPAGAGFGAPRTHTLGENACSRSTSFPACPLEPVLQASLTGPEMNRMPSWSSGLY